MRKIFAYFKSTPFPPYTERIMSSFSITEAATSYGLNPNRNFFPVNSLRLLYFLIADFYTGGNAEVREKIGVLIPKVEAVLTARAKAHTKSGSDNPESDLAGAAATIQDVYQVIDTPTIRRCFEQYFSYLFPLQDSVFVGFYQRIKGNDVLTSSDLVALLKVRAMDSILFSCLISEIIQHHLQSTGSPADSSLARLPVALDFHLNLAYRLNDIIDSIVFAKDDLEAGNFSPFQVIRKVAPEATQAKEMIKSLLSTFHSQTHVFAFPAGLHTQVEAFYTSLSEVVGGV
jgi:hypothetical protein